MHKKTDIQDLDIPTDDVECWERYPKHRWVYNLSRLLDAQGVKWSPFKTNELDFEQQDLELQTDQDIKYKSGSIFVKKPEGHQILSEVYLVKGEIRLIRYFDKTSLKETDSFVGNLELRINAFVSMHFQKFTGVISLEFSGNDVMSVKLRASPELGDTVNPDIIKLFRRIYKKSDSTLNGLTDRIHQETLAS